MIGNGPMVSIRCLRASVFCFVRESVCECESVCVRIVHTLVSAAIIGAINQFTPVFYYAHTHSHSLLDERVQIYTWAFFSVFIFQYVQDWDCFLHGFLSSLVCRCRRKLTNSMYTIRGRDRDEEKTWHENRRMEFVLNWKLERIGDASTHIHEMCL